MPTRASRRLLKSLFSTSALLTAATAYAVPTAMLLSGVGNQRDVEWKTTETQHFRVYHDEKSQALGRYAAQAMETAWPSLSTALGVRLPSDPPPPLAQKGGQVSSFDIIPVVLSTRAEVGGFANPMTQNVELQITSGSQAALFQHELVHRVMYEHMDPGVGPGGRAFSIAMVPTWWLEGLAEYLTESMERQQTLGISRTEALRGIYPTWDSLHNLYNSHGDYGRGYVTSGRFFRYLMGRSKEKSLAALHNDFFWKTLTPPFATAPNIILNKDFGAQGETLYEEFKKEEGRLWKETLAGMPGLAGTSKPVVRLSWIPDSVLTSDKFLTSQLTRKPYSSSILATDLKSRQLERRPVPMEGSGLLVPDLTRSSFWTSRNEEFSNGAEGSRLVYVTTEGAPSELGKGKILSRKEIPLASRTHPAQVMGVASLGEGRALALTNTRGEYALLLVDAKDGSVQEKRRWEIPKSIKLVPARSKAKPEVRSCISVLVDADLEQTSLERVCADGTASLQFPAKKLFIRSGIEEPNGSYTLLVAWGQAQGIVSVLGPDVRGGFPVPEWIDRIIPWHGNDIGAWVFHGDGYELVPFSAEEMMGRYRQWARSLPADSPWQRLGPWTPYEPPFVKIAAEQRELLAKKAELFQNNDSQKSSTDNNKLPKNILKKGSAPYQHKHFFTYPTMVPPYFGGWSLGLASVPLMDEMERYQVQLFGQYNFNTQKFSADLSYIDHRILDNFAVTAFSRERFNGSYFWGPNFWQPKHISPYPTGRGLVYGTDNYLRENGAGVTIGYDFRPTSFSLSAGAEIAEISPSIANDDYRYLRANLGSPERGLLGTGRLALSFNLFDTAFYMEEAKRAGGSHLRWRTSVTLSGESAHSLNPPQDAVGKTQPALNFQKYQGYLTSAFSYDDNVVTLRGSVRGTTGPKSLLLREYYEPYQTYQRGAGMSFNQLNYALMSQGNLFGRLLGTYAFRSSMDYSFPIVKSIDKQLLILYFDSLRGEVVVGHGGVARTENFKEISTRSSASFAARATINIKGFQLFPSLAYGRLLDGNGWSLFSEIAFSNFF